MNAVSNNQAEAYWGRWGCACKVQAVSCTRLLICYQGEFCLFQKRPNLAIKVIEVLRCTSQTEFQPVDCETGHSNTILGGRIGVGTTVYDRALPWTIERTGALLPLVEPDGDGCSR